ncbi:hypothetical protein [Halorussus amylolyticus]|uniref:hypothetical protein n=1 Tax=Halorussus amylolyticus TaxID=1126242 RepID=UPI0010460B37|nr:hypothetical protein [Halorussus amylolyticus]
MTNCHNCGHAGPFVLLAEFALAVPSDPSDIEASVRAPPNGGDAALADLRSRGDCSLAVQCPTCDSTAVGVSATELLARYGSSTTS